MKLVKDYRQPSRPKNIFATWHSTIFDWFFPSAWESHHLIFSLNGTLPRIRLISHSDYVHQLRGHVGVLQQGLEPKRMIYSVLKLCRRCNFVSFSRSQKYYLSFWVGNGEITAQWPLHHRTHKERSLAMLGVLNELGIHPKPQQSSNYMYYDITTYQDMDFYDIHFRHNLELATEFTIRIFSEVFRQDIDDLEIDIG